MFISRVGIITLSFALGRAWGRLFFAPVSVGNMIKGKKSNIAAQKKRKMRKRRPRGKTRISMMLKSDCPAGTLVLSEGDDKIWGGRSEV